eukprot:scaffold66271_cov18-Tisochrysis_lutea.AAC.1
MRLYRHVSLPTGLLEDDSPVLETEVPLSCCRDWPAVWLAASGPRYPFCLSRSSTTQGVEGSSTSGLPEP